MISRFAGLTVLFCVGVMPVAYTAAARAADDNAPAVPAPPTFAAAVSPVLKTYCFKCHGTDKDETELKLDHLGRDFHDGKTLATWERVMEQLEIGEMPPADQTQPAARQREQMIEWIADNLV